MSWQRSGCEQEKSGVLILHNPFLSVRSSIEKVPQALPGLSQGDTRPQKCSWLLQNWQALTHTVLSPWVHFYPPWSETKWRQYWAGVIIMGCVDWLCLPHWYKFLNCVPQQQRAEPGAPVHNRSCSCTLMDVIACTRLGIQQQGIYLAQVKYRENMGQKECPDAISCLYASGRCRDELKEG